MRDSDQLTSASKPPYRGLCATPRDLATYTYPIPDGRPVLFCEEFQGLSENGVRPLTPVPLFARVVRGRTAGMRWEPEGEASETGTRYQGLCRTCGKQEVCVLPKPADGVWDCEELS